MLPPQANFIRKATVCLHSFISICADSETVGMVIDMDQNVNYYGIILLLRQLRESGSFSEKELRRVAARIAADSGADIMISL